VPSHQPQQHHGSVDSSCAPFATRIATRIPTTYRHAHRHAHRYTSLESTRAPKRPFRHRSQPRATLWTEAQTSTRSQVCLRPIPATSATTILRDLRQITRLLRSTRLSKKSHIRRRLPRPSTASIRPRRDQDPSRNNNCNARTLPPAALPPEVWRSSNQTVRQCPSRMDDTVIPTPRSSLTMLLLQIHPSRRRARPIPTGSSRRITRAPRSHTATPILAVVCTPSLAQTGEAMVAMEPH
jgi:hypothetical protein